MGETDSSGDIEALMDQLKEKTNEMADKEKEAIKKANEVFEDCNRVLKKKKPEGLPASEWVYDWINKSSYLFISYK